MKLRASLVAATALAIGLAALPAQAEDFVIGLATAQTGGLAPFDQPSLAGFQMAVDEINAKGGLGGQHKIVLNIKDTRSDTAATVQAAQELVAAGIQVLIKPCDADPSIAAGQVSQAAGIPSFTFCGSTPTTPGWWATALALTSTRPCAQGSGRSTYPARTPGTKSSRH